MTYVRTFEGYAPPPRYDAAADPFTKAILQESDARDGTYTTIETFELTPVDTDPASPTLRNFTTDLATLNPGWYRFIWEDESGDAFLGSPQYSRDMPYWAPSLADVGALIRARTKIPGGGEIGTFNAETRPTGVEAERLIAKAVRRVQTAVTAEPCNDDLRADAGATAAIFAAMLIEQSYWPEQTTAAGSSYANLRDLFESDITALTAAVRANCGEGEDGEEVAGAALPHGGFDDGIPLYGRDWPPSGSW